MWFVIFLRLRSIEKRTCTSLYLKTKGEKRNAYKVNMRKETKSWINLKYCRQLRHTTTDKHLCVCQQNWGNLNDRNKIDICYINWKSGKWNFMKQWTKARTEELRFHLLYLRLSVFVMRKRRKRKGRKKKEWKVVNERENTLRQKHFNTLEAISNQLRMYGNNLSLRCLCSHFCSEFDTNTLNSVRLFEHTHKTRNVNSHKNFFSSSFSSSSHRIG